MQAARDAVGNVREKGKSFLKPKYADQLLGSGLEEQIRRATAKSLPGPDLALNRRVSHNNSFGESQVCVHTAHLKCWFDADCRDYQQRFEFLQRSCKSS